jgi:hypothetical protein
MIADPLLEMGALARPRLARETNIHGPSGAKLDSQRTKVKVAIAKRHRFQYRCFR